MMQPTNRSVIELFLHYSKRALVFIFKYRQKDSLVIYQKGKEVQHVSMDGCHPPTAVTELRVGYNCAV